MPALRCFENYTIIQIILKWLTYNIDLATTKIGSKFAIQRLKLPIYTRQLKVKTYFIVQFNANFLNLQLLPVQYNRSAGQTTSQQEVANHLDQLPDR